MARGDEQGWAAAKPPAPITGIQGQPVLGNGEIPHLRELFKSFHGKSLTTTSLLSQPGTGKGSSASSILKHTDTDGWGGITSSGVVSAVPPGMSLLPALQGLVPTLARSAGLGFETPAGNPGHTGGVLCIALAQPGQMGSRAPLRPLCGHIRWVSLEGTTVGHLTPAIDRTIVYATEWGLCSPHPLLALPLTPSD